MYALEMQSYLENSYLEAMRSLTFLAKVAFSLSNSESSLEQLDVESESVFTDESELLELSDSISFFISSRFRRFIS